jgi:hypothetical protein
LPPEDCSLSDVLAFAGTSHGDERLGRSSEALHDVVEAIRAAVRDGGRRA